MKKTIISLFVIILLAMPVFVSATEELVERKTPVLIEHAAPNVEVKEAPVVPKEKVERQVELVEEQPEKVPDPEPKPEHEPIEAQLQQVEHSALSYIYIVVGVLAVAFVAILVIKKRKDNKQV